MVKITHENCLTAASAKMSEKEKKINNNSI